MIRPVYDLEGKTKIAKIMFFSTLLALDYKPFVCGDAHRLIEHYNEHPEYRYIVIDDEGTFSGGISIDEKEHKSVSMSNFFNHYNGRKQPIEVVLNDAYTAIVLNNFVEVGCQHFTFEKIEELYKAVQKMKKEVSSERN
jgi:hypothetical protein